MNEVFFARCEKKITLIIFLYGTSGDRGGENWWKMARKIYEFEFPGIGSSLSEFVNREQEPRLVDLVEGGEFQGEQCVKIKPAVE